MAVAFQAQQDKDLPDLLSPGYAERHAAEDLPVFRIQCFQEVPDVRSPILVDPVSAEIFVALLDGLLEAAYGREGQLSEIACDSKSRSPSARSLSCM